MSRLVWCIIVLVVSSCSYRYETVNHIGYKSGDLVHTVILKLEEETLKERRLEIVSELESLRSIKETKCLQVATRAETTDPRAKIDYDIILQMTFDSLEDLESYSTNEYHLEVRSGLKDDLAQAPVVYDYWVE